MYIMIKLKNVTKYYDNNKVLDNISFEVDAWEICWFIWENGAGKSTTMKILATLILDHSGEVEIAGKDLRKNIKEIRQIIWFMPDQYWLYDDMTVEEYLKFFMYSYWMWDDDKQIDEILSEVYLLDKKFTKIKWLSRGMTQRILLAKSLVSNPQVLILDEPASGLDPKLRIMLKNLLLKLKKQWKTILVSSHILSELGDYCDKIVFIKEGKIINTSSLEEIMHKSESGYFYIKTDKKDLFSDMVWLENILEERVWILKVKNTSIDKKELFKKLLENDIEIKYYSDGSNNLEEIYMQLD